MSGEIFLQHEWKWMLSRKSQREMSFVKVVYQYNDVVLWQEPALLMEFFERRTSILNKSFLKLRSIVEFYHIQLMISISDGLLIAINEKTAVNKRFLPSKPVNFTTRCRYKSNDENIIFANYLWMFSELYCVIERHARVSTMTRECQKSTSAYDKHNYM